MENFRRSIFIFICMTCLQACTYSINMVHSEGTTSDVIDENQRADPTVSPTITIPSFPGV